MPFSDTLIGYHTVTCHYLIYQLSPRHILGVPAKQFVCGDELRLAVSVPSLVTRLAAADDLGQLGSGGLVELLGCL
jgi:hypothetical protein